MNTSRLTTLERILLGGGFALALVFYFLASSLCDGSPIGHVETFGLTSDGIALRWTYVAAPGAGTHPAVVVFHAGGFVTGAMGPVEASQDLANAGFNVFACEYRLAFPHKAMNTPPHPFPGQSTLNDTGTFPEQTDDVAQAIVAARFDLRCNGWVGAVGGSAGGSHIAFVAATGTFGYDAPDAIACLSGVYDLANTQHLADGCVEVGETCFVENCLTYVGATGPDVRAHNWPPYLDRLAAAAPINFVTSTFPRAFFMVSSMEASELDVYDFPNIKAKLESLGITESTDAAPGLGHYKQWTVPVTVKSHAFDYWSIAKDEIIPFLQGEAAQR
jgi:acetyl esterase/lipase